MNPSQSRSFSLSDFDYELPEALIAQTPAARRSQSRMLRIDAQGQFHDETFSDLLAHLRPNDLLVFNDTKVIKARLHGCKESGGKIEALVERVLDSDRALAHIKASKAPKPGTRLMFSEGRLNATVTDREDDLFVLQFDQLVLDALDEYGEVPLPPYISHQPDGLDESRYQTVFAREPGAVAAPTAGLHIDETMLEALAGKQVRHCFVTLHVGAGTFQPVRAARISDHIMHAERYRVTQTVCDAIHTARQGGGRVIAVGTTSVRALESAAAQGGLNPASKRCPLPHEDDTRLFITPGYQFQVVDALITNFHLPQSTLLMLVSAVTGLNTMKRAYEHAVDRRYRFFSYGDAMFIEQHLPEAAS